MIGKGPAEELDLPGRHMDRRTRVCLWVIVLGLANFLAYTIAYELIGGEAIHGGVRLEQTDGGPVRHYYLTDVGARTEVSRCVWIYSAVHSTSIWATMGAVLLAMLTLAKDRIVASMRSSIVRGRTFFTIVATIVTLIMVVLTVRFVLRLVREVAWPALMGPP